MNHKIGDTIVSTFGSTKGIEFIVKAILNGGFYSCQRKDGENERYYQFNDNTVKASQ